MGAGAARVGLATGASDVMVVASEAPAPRPSVSPSAAPPRTCSIDDFVTADDALDFHGIVQRADTGEVLFERQPEAATPTASVMKLVTAVTALTALGPDTRLPTRVYPGDVAGSVVIVGGGDVTLKSGEQSYYTDATASVSQLADAVEAAGGASRVGVDDSLFTGDTWQPSWNDADRLDGSTAAVSALMVDAGRSNATAEYSTRTLTPTQDAADAFADALGATVDDTVGIEPGSEPIAEVWSPTIRELVDTMLLDSDNVIAESLARLVAIEQGTGSDFAAIDEAQRDVLDGLGVSTAGFVGADGSGLSRDNRASAETIVDLLDLIAADTDGLGTLRESLPENMVSGTLETRIPTVPDGAIEAKTGFTDQVYGLAGFVTLPDGSELTFAMFVTVDDPEADTQVTSRANRDALDATAAAVYECGLDLGNR
jgi:D-alanyl-D-alanine carboxypeptidase/D-alanyl-D-alanine-endopeptidase (penicillin-binding protein 4)